MRFNTILPLAFWPIVLGLLFSIIFGNLNWFVGVVVFAVLVLM